MACELFGCTGWARKFRLMVLDEQGGVIQHQIKANQTFTLRFVPLRPIREEEWCLLDCTLRLIAEYGAIGGKTVLKPSDEQNRQNAPYHQDYGLVQYLSGPSNWRCEKGLEEIRKYVRLAKWRSVAHEYQDDRGQKQDFSWASLKNFWCVKGHYLARKNAVRSTFNKVIGRRQPKELGQQLEQDTLINRWLAGCPQESKKVFSFKHPKEGGRTFGFVKPETVSFDQMKQRLKEVWSDLKDDEFFTDEEILKHLSGGAKS